MGKATVATPLYISVAWILMVTYQMFTRMAVEATLTNFGVVLPAISEWLFSRMDMITFIHAFAWVFVLSSVIPSLLLGKERSVIVQFFVCLTLVFISFIVQDLVNIYWKEQFTILASFSLLLRNPFLALAYLSIPYIFMLAIDIKAKIKRDKGKKLDRAAEIYMQHSEKRKNQTSSF
ncbi:MAG: hypothetical protein ACUVQX_01125 [Candidatus Bathycorpusculaceae bacterium]